MAHRYPNYYPPNAPVDPRPADPLGRGVMQVDVLKGSGFKVARMFGHGSRYVRMRYGHERKSLRTPVHHGGISTMWNVTFVYNIMNPPHRTPILQFEVWKTHWTRDDELVGLVSIENSHEYISQFQLELGTPYIWLPIFYKAERDSEAQVKGEILVRFFFQRKDEYYFGEHMYREDHLYINSETTSVDIMERGERATYRILDNNAGPPSLGASISLNLPEHG